MVERRRYNKAQGWFSRELDAHERTQAQMALEDRIRHLVRICGLDHCQTKNAYRAYLKVGGYLRLTVFLPPEDEDEDEDEEVTEADIFREVQEVRSEQS